MDVDLAQLAAGFKYPGFTVGETENGLGEVKVASGTATYTSTGDAGVDYFTVSVEDSEGSSWERRVGGAIFECADDLD